ncbi:hypothetical protein CEXT_227481 [Caerostris extrusa]|uniref:Uncharacterized protein n=1 Tax=Caerostris extrusa TaxID=172846 RepID=A0AAV4WML6_CAEEX|nr:hypothetical protein CEXT_227481 [Caerostris extrusa]
MQGCVHGDGHHSTVRRRPCQTTSAVALTLVFSRRKITNNKVKCRGETRFPRQPWVQQRFCCAPAAHNLVPLGRSMPLQGRTRGGAWESHVSA